MNYKILSDGCADLDKKTVLIAPQENGTTFNFSL